MFDSGVGWADDGAEVAPEPFAPSSSAPTGAALRAVDGVDVGVDGTPVVTRADVARWVDPGRVPSVHDVSAGIDEAVALQARIDALEGRKLAVVERARRAAAGCEAALLDDADLELRRASVARRRQLAERAFVADLATALRLSEQQASHLVDTARTLTEATTELAADAATNPEADAVAGGGPGAGTSTLVELCRGRFSAAHARAMADTLAELPSLPDGGGEARARVQAAALPAAAHCTPTQFRRRLRRARDLAHPVPLTTRHRAAADKRAVYLDPAPDGMAWLTAHLPAVFAHAIHDRLTRAACTARQAGTTEEPTGNSTRSPAANGAENSLGNPAGGGRTLRTLDQLRADTLTALLLAGNGARTGATGPGATGPGATGPGAAGAAGIGADDVEAGAGLAGFVPGLAQLARRITPSVRVTVPVFSLLGGDAPAELDGHGPVDADTAGRLTANAPSLRRLLVDPVDGRALATDPGTYTVPAALRALLQARDTTCRFPGCTRKAAACDVDHITAWADGGRTSADNLAHLCRAHHVIKHQTRWRVTPHDDGTLTWTSPTGRAHHDRNPGNDLTRHDLTRHDLTGRDPALDPATQDRGARGPSPSDLGLPDHEPPTSDPTDPRRPNNGPPDARPPAS
ncbi:hypothetical protein GCM10009809_17490 [Isoptericola hypogeus]|uniref:HNH nuclease domain-containing protein n=1 Tax=Isoptericola hypogeus TaxID=300179 RepID=A0ABN2JCA8_9MICO